MTTAATPAKNAPYRRSRTVSCDGGRIDPGTTMAMIPVFEEAQVPLISLGGAIEIISQSANVFRRRTDRMA